MKNKNKRRKAMLWKTVKCKENRKKIYKVNERTTERKNKERKKEKK